MIFFGNLCRRIPYTVALKHKHGVCAALLNPSSAEPLVWPSPLKFISELNQEAKALLEQALMDANKEREKNILKGTAYSLPSPSHSDAGIDDNMSEVISYYLPFSEGCSFTLEFIFLSLGTKTKWEKRKKKKKTHHLYNTIWTTFLKKMNDTKTEGCVWWTT